MGNGTGLLPCGSALSCVLFLLGLEEEGYKGVDTTVYRVTTAIEGAVLVGLGFLLSLCFRSGNDGDR